MGFLLSGFREVADAFQVANDSGKVIYIVAVALRAFLQVALVDMSAVVTDGIRDVKRKIVAAFASGYAEQLSVLFLAQVLLEVAMQCGSTGEVFDVFLAVEAELVEDVGVGVFHDVEIAVVAVAVHLIAVFPVPLGVFHTHVFGGDHLAVEHQLFGAVFFVVSLNEAEHVLDKLFVVGVVGDRDLEEFGGFHQPVHTDREILA